MSPPKDGRPTRIELRRNDDGTWRVRTLWTSDNAERVLDTSASDARAAVIVTALLLNRRVPQ